MPLLLLEQSQKSIAGAADEAGKAGAAADAAGEAGAAKQLVLWLPLVPLLLLERSQKSTANAADAAGEAVAAADAAGEADAAKAASTVVATAATAAVRTVSKEYCYCC